MTSLNFVVNPGRRGVIAAFLGLAAAFILLAPVTVAAQTDQAVNRRKPALPFRANCVTTRLEHGEIEWEDADLKRVLDSATYH